MFTVSLYGDVGHHPEAQRLDPSESMDTARRQHFTPWGWGTWKDRFDEMAHVYTGWDGQMNFEMVHIVQGVNYEAFGQGLRKNRHEVFPVLSRANNIGMEDGIHSKWFKPDKMKVVFVKSMPPPPPNSPVHLRDRRSLTSPANHPERPHRRNCNICTPIRHRGCQRRVCP